MFSEFLSFCFMGVSSNLEVFLPEKHPKDHADQEFSLLLRPAMETHDEECQASTRDDHDLNLRPKQQLVQERDQEQDEDHQEQHRNVTVPVVPPAPLGLKLKIPSYEEVEREKDDSNDGFKTPTSPEHKIPAILRCPPAPRKPKPWPSTKRKDCRPRIVLDLSQEIESLFPTPFAVDLGAGGKNKKVKLFKEW